MQSHAIDGLEILAPPSRATFPRELRTFLRNHLREAVAIDFALVPTVTFRLVSVFAVLILERRGILHIGATERSIS
jgi:hypothetical protein